jgi:spore coat polysaccharide biosynthesis protein SpsF
MMFLPGWLQAARMLNADVIVRLTGDNPMVDGTLIDFVLDGFLSAEPRPDYAANFGQDPNETEFPYGLYAEVATFSALERSRPLTTVYDREHVTWFIRSHPEQFRVLELEAPGQFQHDSLTVDTPEDYERVAQIFENCYLANPNFGFVDLMVRAA